MPGELIPTGRREIISVLAQTTRHVAAGDIDLVAEFLYVVLTCQAPRGRLAFSAAQTLLAGGRELGGVLLQTFTAAAAWLRPQAKLPEVLAARPWSAGRQHGLG